MHIECTQRYNYMQDPSVQSHCRDSGNRKSVSEKRRIRHNYTTVHTVQRVGSVHAALGVLLGTWAYFVFHATVGAVASASRRPHTLLSLPSVAEPNSDHLLLEAEVVCDSRNVERRGLRLSHEVTLERVFCSDANRRPSLAASLGRLLLLAVRSSRLFRLLQPLLEDRLQLLSILEAQLEVFKPANCRLTEVGALNLGQCLPHVGLRESQLYATLFEAGGKLLQLLDLVGVRVGRLGLRDAARGAVRALDDGLIGHGRDGRPDLHGREQRGWSTGLLDEGRRRHMYGPTVRDRGVDGERDASERRGLQRYRLTRTQDGLHGQSRDV